MAADHADRRRAGAGIAATFNTPIGGVLFAIEIMLHEVSARTLVPVTIATATASYIGRLIFGSHPSFSIPALETPYFHLTHPFVLVLYPGLGALAGLASVSLHPLDLCLRRLLRHPHRRELLHSPPAGHVAGGRHHLCPAGTTGHYQVEGVGYATVQDILSGQLSWFLLALFGLKLLTTSLTLGSGASGGVFSPALFLGATLGGVYGLAARQVFPGLAIDPAAFAVAGMAGMVGGSTGAAMTAIVMIFEMTLDYTVIIPMTITVALSYGVRTLLQPQSIYTLKLARRGHRIPASLRTNFYSLKKRKGHDGHSLPGPGCRRRRSTTSCKQRRGRLRSRTFSSRRRRGSSATCPGTRCSSCPEDPTAPSALADLADPRFIVVNGESTLHDVMIRAASRGQRWRWSPAAGEDLSGQRVAGLITKGQIANAVIEELAVFAD